MSVATEISRIQTARNAIRSKAVELGIGTGTDDLTKLAAEIEAIENRGAVSATVQEGDTYTIPKGYHNGSGTVSGVSGGGNYNLQSKTATPTKSQQNVVPSGGPMPIACSDAAILALAADSRSISPWILMSHLPSNGRQGLLNVARQAHRASGGVTSRDGKGGCGQAVNLPGDRPIVCH